MPIAFGNLKEVNSKKGNLMNEVVKFGQELPEVEVREFIVDDKGNEVPVEKTA